MRALVDITDRQVADFTVDAFGLWKNREVDGLVYQEKVRSEWQRFCQILAYTSDKRGA